MSYWSAMCLVLVVLIIFPSWSEQPTRRRYLTSAWCFAILTLGSVFLAVYPMFFNIRMANGFGPRPVSSAAYVLPLFVILGFSYPALSLFPFMSAEKVGKCCWWWWG
jgi:magnesium-transporting ATPase (P-type)